MEAAVPRLRQRIGPKAREKVAAQQIVFVHPLTEKRKLTFVVAVVDNHVVASSDEAMILEATEPHMSFRVTIALAASSPRLRISIEPRRPPRRKSIVHARGSPLDASTT